jgi:hypothetical protein
MRSSIGRILLAVIGSLVIVTTSFFVTLKLLDYWLTPADPTALVIHVVDATYGLSCKDFTPEAPHTNVVKAGNATAALAQACDTKNASCMFAVDVTKLGDPANGCGKDFTASWRCGNEQKAHQFFLSAEASGRSALLSCPAP